VVKTQVGERTRKRTKRRRIRKEEARRLKKEEAEEEMRCYAIRRKR